MPAIIELEYEQVERHWDSWLLWRSFGRRNSSGGFEPSVDYLQAMLFMPSEQVDVFTKLDAVYSKMEKQYIKQKVARETAKGKT